MHASVGRAWLVMGVTIAAAAWTPTHAAGQRALEAHRPRSVASVIADQRQLVLDALAAEPEGDIVIGGLSFPSLPSTTYMDSVRAVSPERRDVIRRWAKVFGLGSAHVDAYRTEYLFREDGLDCWLAVPATLTPTLALLEPGDPVTLFVVWAGARGRSDAPDWVFLVYGFRRSPEPPGGRAGQSERLHDRSGERLRRPQTGAPSGSQAAM